MEDVIAFLIPYFIFMVIEGIPIMMLEFAIGQKMRMSSWRVWSNVSPALRGLGLASVIVSLTVCCYYMVVIAWCFYYFFISFQKNLPWQVELCANYGAYEKLQDQVEIWEKNYTHYKQLNQTIYGHKTNQTKTTYENTKLALERNFSSCCVIDSPQWYFYSSVLNISIDIEDYSLGLNGKLVGCLIVAWVVVYFCVINGIKSSGKVVYFTATFPYVILLILFFRGVTLDGAGSGIETFFSPEWSKLNDPKIWKDAAAQMFFTLGISFGTLITFASYMPKNNQCIRDSYTVVFVNCGTSIFSGLVVFTILGYRELKTGIKAADVGSGPGLAFMAFSDAITQLDASPFWAVLFFFMLILLGIDSAFGLLEGAVNPLYELGLFPKKLNKSIGTGIVAVVLFLIGLSMVAGNGFYIFQIFDDHSATIPLLLIGVFQCIGVSWVYGNDRFADDIEGMTGKRPWIGWMICWKYISPLALIILIIATLYDMGDKGVGYYTFVACLQDPFSNKYPGVEAWLSPLKYPGWARFLVALVIMISTVPILIFMIIGWPKDWRAKFHNTLFSSIKNYYPDPPKKKDDNLGY
ncbi:sodium-dependent neutral amino acid transporter B(0)AT2-like isoform X2 [Dendronephthya gigantea]|uniref:sodium-dependent neutral amino acid transporter B(0)AT2-like isoform X2 n=1 Tax=Dendronephthya gigantea TaxID=151771 RepID=UPI00106CEEC0|nr:sodium-dependent neutral amino acid transporter B(0)AT2-like isoform X2 [Dendronephthya gigantea]